MGEFPWRNQSVEGDGEARRDFRQGGKLDPTKNKEGLQRHVWLKCQTNLACAWKIMT
jgi:hypothetical protein